MYVITTDMSLKQISKVMDITHDEVRKKMSAAYAVFGVKNHTQLRALYLRGCLANANNGPAAA